MKPMTKPAAELMPPWVLRLPDWVRPDEIQDLMSPAYAVRISDALLDVGAATRVHDGVHLIAASS